MTYPDPTKPEARPATPMRAARQEGRAAAKTGASNPYPFGSPANHQWAAGWHEASNFAGEAAS